MTDLSTSATRAERRQDRAPQPLADPAPLPATDPVVASRASDARDGVPTAGRVSIRPRLGDGPATSVEITAGPGMPGYPTPPAAPATGDGSAAHGSARPGPGEHLTEATFHRVADAADTIGMNNAARHMRHDLGNSGETLWVDPARMAADMPRNAALMDAAFQQDVVARAQARVAANWTDEPMHVRITTPWRSDTHATQADSRDRFYAVGGYSDAQAASVTVRADQSGRPVIAIEANRHIFDRYNWDEGKSGTIAGIRVTDEQLARLHETGLAHAFEVRGTTRLDPVTIRT